MSDWTQMQKDMDEDVLRRVSRLEKMLSIYNRRGMQKQASLIPGRICRLKTRLATISLNAFRNSFNKSA